MSQNTRNAKDSARIVGLVAMYWASPQYDQDFARKSSPSSAHPNGSGEHARSEKSKVRAIEYSRPWAKRQPPD